MNKKIHVSVLAVFIAATLVGSVASTGTSMAYATQSDSALQSIEQGQVNSQETQCVAGGSDDETNGNGYDKADKKHDKADKKHDKADKKHDETNGNGYDKADKKHDETNGNGYDKADKKHDKADKKREHFDGVFASCNNVGLDLQTNDGKLALGQR